MWEDVLNLWDYVLTLRKICLQWQKKIICVSAELSLREYILNLRILVLNLRKSLRCVPAYLRY